MCIRDSDIPYHTSNYNKIHNLQLKLNPHLESQIAAISDDIAYNNHDLDDGLRANLFTENDISNLPIVGECFSLVDAKYPNLDPIRRRNEALRRIFNEMVEDCIHKENVKKCKIIYNIDPNFFSCDICSRG